MYSGTINNQIIKQALVEILGATLDRNGLPSAKSQCGMKNLSYT